MELDKDNKPMRAIIYTRVSTKEQVEGYSLTYQEKLCADFVEHQGWEIDKVFREEGESAKTADRTELLKLLKYVQDNKGKINLVLVHKLDRIARNLADHMAIRASLAKFGVILRSVTESIDETSQGKFMENIFAAVAQFDNDVRSERTKAGMKEKAEQGLWPWGAPLGYKNSPSGLIIDQEKAPYIQKAFEVYSQGIYTIKEMSKKLNKWGLRSKGGKKISPQAVVKIFHSRLYIGGIVVPKWGVDNEGLHKPLISKELFYKVQKIRQSRTSNAPVRLVNNPDFPLKNVTLCKDCNTYLTASWSKGRRGGRYGYYHCIKCGKTRIAKNDLESAFYRRLREIQPKEAVKILFKEILIEVWNQKQGEAMKAVIKIDRDLVTLRDMKNKLFAKNLQGLIEDIEFREQKEYINSQITVKEIERSEYREEETNIDYLVALSESLFTSVALVWLEAPFEDKLKFQTLMFPEGVFYKDKNIGTTSLGLPFNLISESKPSKTTLAPSEGFEPPTSTLEPSRSIH